MKTSGHLTEIVPGLPGILLLSHGTLALGLLDSLRLITGDTKNILAIAIEEGDDLNVFHQEIFQACDQFPGDLFIFIDLLGGTPCNQFMLGSNKINKLYHAYAGMNLPMIIEAVMGRKFASGQDLAQTINTVGPESFVDLNDMIRKLNEDE